jgi:DNA (cytosine-5)-methyltransferase 1
MKRSKNSKDINTKWKFYSYLYKPKIADKGDIRSFIGLMTWVTEYYNYNQNSRKDHYDALNSSIDFISNLKSRVDFNKEFDKALKIWQKEGGRIKRENKTDPSVKPPVKKIKKWKENGYNLVSLFSGAFGLDLGFMANGFKPLLALDNNPASYETIHRNLPDLEFINENIEKRKTKSLLDEIGLDVGEIDVLTGGPPCQPFSTAGRRASLQDPRASPLKEFIRFIKEAQPKCFVMEEVKGLLSARIKHVPIIDRGKNVLTADELPGSAFLEVYRMLEETGYKFSIKMLNAADFGAPQVRNRLIIIGNRDKTPNFPDSSHSGIGQEKINNTDPLPWSTFWDATCDLQGKKMEFPPLSPSTSRIMKFIPPGGYWKHLPSDMIKTAMGGAYFATGGKTGFFRRLSWDTPAPTVITSPHRMSSMLCHPEELRPISVEEYKRVQGFPDDWKIPGSTSVKYHLIGNAVPVYLSDAIANHVVKFLDNSKIS